jgi:hypothetical protein
MPVVSELTTWKPSEPSPFANSPTLQDVFIIHTTRRNDINTSGTEISTQPRAGGSEA